MSQQNWDDLERRYKQQIIEGNVLASVWTDEDVQGRADEMEIELSKEQIQDVLSLLDSKHDASVGINWDTIDYWVGHVGGEHLDSPS